MANKTHSTRQKQSFRLEARKPRNPFALRARQRSAGAHVKSASAVRGQSKRLLKKLLDENED